MIEYHKIQTIFKRDERTKRGVLALLPSVPSEERGAGLAEAERWIDSLHEDANGLVWTTKAELRGAVAAARFVESITPAARGVLGTVTG